MLLEVRELAERLFAVGAVIGLDTKVDTQVLCQVGGIGKGLGTVWALVGLGLCVGLGVDLHLRLGEEGEWANLAPGEKRRYFKKYSFKISSGETHLTSATDPCPFLCCRPHAYTVSSSGQ